MSTIVDLTIKGVRSFSHEEEQTLKFLRPLTVITGHNGAGKTTIIECLRYACSGFFPPGAQNSCFVHDLKKAGSSEVEGFVDIKFKNKASQGIQVRRYFKAFQKRHSTKIEFQSLPPTIGMLSNDGRVITSRSLRISDLNEEVSNGMVAGLGVSQTIMGNVIFCHQDESDWPLRDGKHLKEKFDEIFGATRYIKALDNIKKLKKELNGIISLLQKDVKHFEEWNEEAKQETRRLKRMQKELDMAKTILADCSLHLEPKQRKLKDIQRRELYFQELNKTISILNAEKKIMESVCEEFQDYCATHNEEELTSVIDRKTKIKAKKEGESNKLQWKINGLKQNENDLQFKRGQLKQGERDFETLKYRLQYCVNRMAGTVPGSQSRIDWKEEGSLKDGLEEFQKRSQEKKRQMETQLDAIRNKISQLIHHETADVEFLEKEKQKLEKANADIMCKRNQEVVQLVGAHAVNDWFRRLDECHRGQKERIEHTRERLLSKKMEQCREQCTEKQILDKLEKKEKKLKNLEEKLSRECGNQTGQVTPLNKGLQLLIRLPPQHQHRSFSAKESIFQGDKSFPTTSSSADLKCPLCTRKFIGNESEKQTFLQIMKDKLPSNVKDTVMGEEQLTQEWENFFKMHRTTFLKEKIAKLSDKDIPHLVTKLMHVQEKLENLESDIREEEETLRQLQEEENLAAKLIPEISIFDYLIKGVSKCTDEIEAFKRQRKSANVKKRLEFDHKQLAAKISMITQDLVTLENYIKDLDRFTSLRENLKENRCQLQEVQEKIANETKQMNDLNSIISKFDKSISKNKDKVKRLRDYKSQLERKRVEIEKVEQQLYTAMEDQRKARDSSVTAEKKEQLKREISDLQTRKSEADGSLNVLLEVVEDLQNKLSHERYHNVNDKHRECVIDLRTTEIANKDLKKYYDALDWAIIEFHKIKMEEINRIANEYWTKIYKGNDIDFIKIRSEASSSETSARRSYNYRVVMVSDGVEMDMRGRCSAGQKVLASLIIRLALAETFCLSCGVLALDEPTANLDYENKKGLASALTEIIEDKKRYKDSNFQLVIITHDEAFVEMLECSGYADHFYRIIKDDNGNSIIDRKNISDLQS